jgi:hypothetical protein
LLVVEVRNRALLVLKDLRAPLKEIVAGQQNLPPVAGGIIILLDDGQHGVNGDAVPTTTQRLGNVAGQTEAELLHAGSAQVCHWFRFSRRMAQTELDSRKPGRKPGDR